MRYYYDASGFISSATVYTLSNGNVTGTYTYLYRTNIQGDVVGVYSTDGTLLVSYVYDAWGNFQEITHTSSQDTAIASSLPFHYRSYYYDAETNLYYLNTRYYDPQIGRFINADDISYLGANGDLEGYNLYAYCSNNPVMGYDPMGTWNWRNFWDGVVTAVSVVAGVVVASITDNVLAGVATTGAINNAVNAVYYNWISDGDSIIDESRTIDGEDVSYYVDDDGGFRYINRWDRLDYTKNQTEDEFYNLNALRYYGEYNVHMYGWMLSGWAYEKDIFLFSSLAKSSIKADVDPHNGEEGKNAWRNIFYYALGLLGI